MADLLIVDGYNFIYSVKKYNGFRRESLELARVKLIEALAAYKIYSGRDVVVVFDAARSEIEEDRQGEVLGVTVIFSRKGEKADSVIERLAYQEAKERLVIVATSDYLQQKVVFKPGILRMSSRELEQLLTEVWEAVEEQQGRRVKFRLEDYLDEAVKKALQQLVYKR
jgi:hypothetical protein